MARVEARPASGRALGGGRWRFFFFLPFFFFCSTSSPLRFRRPGGQGGDPAAPTARAPRRGPAASPPLTPRRPSHPAAPHTPPPFTPRRPSQLLLPAFCFSAEPWGDVNFLPGLVSGADLVACRRRLSGYFPSLGADSELGVPWIRQSLVGSLVAARGRIATLPCTRCGV